MDILNTMNTETLAILAVVVLLVIAIAAWLWSQRQQSRRLEERLSLRNR